MELPYHPRVLVRDARARDRMAVPFETPCRWLLVLAWPAVAIAQQVDAPQRLEHAARVMALAEFDGGKVLVGGGSDGSIVYWSRSYFPLR